MDIDTISKIINIGIEKVSLNTIVLNNPKLIETAASKFTLYAITGLDLPNVNTKMLQDMDIDSNHHETILKTIQKLDFVSLLFRRPNIIFSSDKIILGP